MPHRVLELEKISAELINLGKRANDIGELQVAKAIVDAIAVAHAAKSRISSELGLGGQSDRNGSS